MASSIDKAPNAKFSVFFKIVQWKVRLSDQKFRATFSCRNHVQQVGNTSIKYVFHVLEILNLEVRWERDCGITPVWCAWHKNVNTCVCYYKILTTCIVAAGTIEVLALFVLLFRFCVKNYDNKHPRSRWNVEVERRRDWRAAEMN